MCSSLCPRVLTRKSKNVVSWVCCSAVPATGGPCPSLLQRRYFRRWCRPPEAAAPVLGDRSSSDRTLAVSEHRVTKTQVRHRGDRLRILSLADRTSPSIVPLRGAVPNCRERTRFHARARAFYALAAFVKSAFPESARAIATSPAPSRDNANAEPIIGITDCEVTKSTCAIEGIS